MSFRLYAVRSGEISYLYCHFDRSGEISYNNPLTMPRHLHSKHFVFFSRHDIAPVIFLAHNPKCRNRVLIVISPSRSPKGARATAVEKSHKEKCIQFTKKRGAFLLPYFTHYLLFSNHAIALSHSAMSSFRRLICLLIIS